MIPALLFNEIIKEVQFKNTLSSGKGGQHVNKVSTKVTLIWDIQNTKTLNNEQRIKLKEIFPSRINNDFVYSNSSDESRYVFQNKKACIKKLKFELDKLFHQPKKRLAVKPSASSIEKRLNEKKWKSLIKQNRKFNFD